MTLTLDAGFVIPSDLRVKFLTNYVVIPSANSHFTEPASTRYSLQESESRALGDDNILVKRSDVLTV
jgi:hypothetical protein